MCGVWGFDTNGFKVDAGILKTIVELADERGGHSYGFFGIVENKVKMYKESGRANSELISRMAENCSVAIGHSRLATFGGRGLENTQPLVLDSYAIAHNGNILDYKEIMHAANYKPKTDVDSEALQVLLQNNTYDIDGVFLAIELKSENKKIISHSKNLPLFIETIKGVTYYCSKKWRTI